MTGQRSGVIYAQNNTRFSRSAQILGFNFSATASRDSGSGQATGRVQPAPIVITKEMDGSSPLVLNMFTTNEVIQAIVQVVEESSGAPPPSSDRVLAL